MRTVLLAFTLLQFCHSPVRAAILKHDFLEPGDGLLTYDNVNQREWLDLPYVFTSLENVQSQMLPGEFLEDFNFATEEDVRELHLSAGPTIYRPDGIDHLIDHLGFMFRETGGVLGLVESTYGMVAVDFVDEEPVFDGTAVSFENVGIPLPPGSPNRPLDIPTGRRLSVTSLQEREDNNWQLPDGYFIVPNSLTMGNGPFWLYREAVPEPSTLSLVSCIASCLGATRLSRRGLA